MTCDICGCPDSRTTYTILQECGDCGHVAAPINLTKAEINKLYENNYFNGEEYVDYVAEEISLRRNYQLRNRELRPFLDLQNSSVLDVGCAYGFYVDETQKVCKSAKGIDIAKEAVDHGRKKLGLDLLAGDLLSYDFGYQKFDLITMWDTIEHLQYPSKYLGRAAELLTSSGIFAFTTGDISALLPRLRGRKWRMIHPPTHIHYFTTGSAKRLLSQHGFEICSIQHNGVYRTLGNIAFNVFVLRNKHKYVYTLIKKLGIDNVNFYLNTFDIMTVIAKKK